MPDNVERDSGHFRLSNCNVLFRPNGNASRNPRAKDLIVTSANTWVLFQSFRERIQSVQALGRDDGHVVIGLAGPHKVDESNVLVLSRELERQRGRIRFRNRLPISRTIGRSELDSNAAFALSRDGGVRNGIPDQVP